MVACIQHEFNKQIHRLLWIFVSYYETGMWQAETADRDLLYCRGFFQCLWFGPTARSLCWSSVSLAAFFNNGCTLYCVRKRCMCVNSQNLFPSCFNLFLLSLLVFLCRKAVNSWCRWGTGRYEPMCALWLWWDWVCLSLSLFYYLFLPWPLVLCVLLSSLHPCSFGEAVLCLSQQRT